MGIDIKINIDLSLRQKKIVQAAVVTGAVIGALGIGIAIAAPHPFVTGDLLTAANLNTLNVATNGSVSYSVGATKYCGAGPTNTTGATSYNSATGYPGAKAMCQASVGCGLSPTAHICDSQEILRSAQLGIAMPEGWFSTATYATQGTNVISDCYGWTASGSTDMGATWSGGTSPDPTIVACNYTQQPVLCCD